MTTTPVQFDIVDLFNYIKTFTVHEMAKAEKILHSPHTGCEGDIEKVAAQGTHALACDLFHVLTKTVNEALAGEFNFKNEITNLVENIKEIDPFLVNKIQFAVVAPAAAANSVAAPESGAPSEEVIN